MLKSAANTAGGGGGGSVGGIHMQLAAVANVSLGHWGESEEAQIGSPCGSQRP